MCIQCDVAARAPLQLSADRYLILSHTRVDLLEGSAGALRKYPKLEGRGACRQSRITSGRAFCGRRAVSAELGNLPYIR